jgi:molybdenum cofactor cytidylyltransferase
VLATFTSAGVAEIIVVTGGAREQVDALIDQCQTMYPVRSVFNERYLEDEMLNSLQCGLRAIADQDVGAVLIGLGDQPQVQERSVRLMLEAYVRTQNPLVVPSHQMRRGHPWLAARSLWVDLLGMSRDKTLRDFLNDHADTIQYVNIDSPDVLADLDTPDQYRASRP